MAPLVSVIMPCFNAGRMLEPAMQSVFMQTHAEIELIFVDNNSTDGSAELAQTLGAASGRPFRLVRCPSQGANHARNQGYAWARGDYIQWMDADDALGREKIALQLAALTRKPEAAIAYCDWMSSRHRPDGGRDDRVVTLRQVDDQVARTLSGVWYPPHTYLIRRQEADRLQAEHGWLAETNIGTDVEYSAIAAMLGIRFLHVSGGRVQYNTWSPKQLSGANTLYGARVAALRTIYLRLQELARRPDVAPRITARHRILLEQDWNIWAMPKGTVKFRKLSSERYTLCHVASGHMIDVSAREAMVAVSMQKSGARAIAHHALIVARLAIALHEDFPFIVATLDRYRQEGLLTPAVPAARALPYDVAD